MCAQSLKEIPKPTGEVTDDEIWTLALKGWNAIGDVEKIASTVLYKPRVNPDGPTIAEMADFLNKLEYGPAEVTPYMWDCTEKALWACVHARNHYPGCPIGMAEGENRKGEGHAVVIIWSPDLKNFKYYDPLERGLIDYNPKPFMITTFPMDPIDNKDDVDPMTSLHMTRMKDKDFRSTEEKYFYYPLETKDPNAPGVLDFLSIPDSIVTYPCDSITGAFHQKTEEKDYESWLDYDQAFWSYMHVRKLYQGCAIGVAWGVPENDDYSHWVNMIWIDKGGKPEAIFWDPGEDVQHQVKFSPKRIFF